MDFGITKFMSKVDALGGIARKNRFSVQITPPTTLVSDVNAATIISLLRQLHFLLELLVLQLIEVVVDLV